MKLAVANDQHHRADSVIHFFPIVLLSGISLFQSAFCYSSHCRIAIIHKLLQRRNCRNCAPPIPAECFGDGLSHLRVGCLCEAFGQRWNDAFGLFAHVA